jgi:hypothetical protein
MGIKHLVAFGLVLFILMAGCCIAPLPPPQNKSNAICNDASCFITAADNCGNESIIYTDSVGTFNYTTSNCVFFKTLVSLNANETQDMKNALEGKSMTCVYQQGQFDQRWVSSLIYGTENCTGDLKEALGELLVFT